MRAGPPSSGFSLLELIVVMSLGVVLATISVPAYQGWRPSLNLRMAARQVVMDLKVARMRAVAQNVDHRILFPVGGGGYQFQRRGLAQYEDDGPAVTLPVGVTIAGCSARDSAISFRPRGNAGSFGTVVVQNGDGDVRSVIVDIAGRIRVE